MMKPTEGEDIWTTQFLWLPDIVTGKDGKRYWMWLVTVQAAFFWCGNYGSYWKLWHYKEME